MALKVARLVSAFAVAASLAVSIAAISEHDAERARWEHHRSAIETERYDAAASDRAYDASRRAHRRAGWSAMLFVASVCLMLALGEGAPEPRIRSGDVGALRRNTATGIDLGIAIAIATAWWLDDAESALLHALASSAPILALASHALPLHLAGRTAGMAATGLRARTTRGQAWAASALLPMAILGVLRPSWAGLHWRAVGVAPRRDAE